MSASTQRVVGRSAAAIVSAAVLVMLALSEPGLAQRGERRGLSASGQPERRNYDAREAGSATDAAPRTAEAAAPGAAQLAALEVLRRDVVELDATFDPATGVTRSLWSRVGYLTAPDSRSPREIADSLIQNMLGPLGLLESDVGERELTDAVYSRVTGATHIYYRQRIRGVPVYNGQLHVNVNRDGRVLSINNSFFPNLDATYATLLPRLDAAAAVRGAADHLEIPAVAVQTLDTRFGSPGQKTRLAADAISLEPIEAQLVLLPIRRGDIRLAWNFQVQTPGREHAYDFTVDAESGTVWTRFDWMASDQYRVYPRPVESPRHASSPPPADGRTTVVNPAHLIASPFGWHDVNGAAGADYTTMRGNNVHAYADPQNFGVPPAAEPDCGSSLNCAFILDLGQAPSTYVSAAVTNLFYWNNLVHDVQYQYGFDEAAGNFQVNNYGRGGLGSDDVRAEAQDGGGLNNANFYTPPDGQRPRMQMYLWSFTDPQVDGDFDSSIIVHEYGHGIAIRQVGGPSNSSCLANAQQPGEGLSDWWSLVYTAKPGDTGPQPRGIGTYALGEPPTGLGIRGLPYTTNTAVNAWTYQSISGQLIPHGVGAVWAQGMWRVYWALVTQHGFSPDLYTASGGAGNQRAMLYVNEGLKNTACSPTFTDVRDGIIQAAVDSYGGEDVCLIWDAFAGFGLGSDAVSGGSGSTSPSNGFNKPIACGGTPPAEISIDDVRVNEGNSGATTARFTVSLGSPAATEVRVRYETSDGTAIGATSISASGPVAIPEFGAASPYPSTLQLSGVPGTIQRLRVRLNRLSHTYPSDLDVLLVGPGGQQVMLMSDAGGGTGVSDVDLTFQDGGAPMPNPIVAGVFAPVDILPGEILPAPAPAGPYSTSLAGFNGSSPNGTWRLYVFDDANADAGSLSSWSLLVTTTASDYLPAAGVLVFPAGVSTRAIDVTINGDTVLEEDERFTVTLSDPVGGTLVDAEGIGTIVNDEILLPPGAASLKTPLRRMGLTPTFQWLAAPTAARYQLWVDDSSGNRIRQWYTAAEAGCPGGGMCSVSPAVTLNAGNISWWVQTSNSAGSGPWSAKGTFRAALERLVVGLGVGGRGEFQAWSHVPPHRQASLDLPWPAYNVENGELHPAVGDVDGDGLDETVVGLGVGGQGWMAVFDDAAHGMALLRWIQLPWNEYNTASGAIWPAVGDVDGDGRDEIVAGLGLYGGGYFAVFGDAAQGFAFQSWHRLPWPAYNGSSSGETHPAVADLDGDAIDEIVIGLGSGGAGWLAIFDRINGAIVHRRWLRVAWAEYAAGGGETYPAAGDIDGDGRGEIVVGLGSGSRGYVEVFDDAAAGFAHRAWLQVSWPAYANATGETHPAVGNLDGDTAHEIVLGLGSFEGQGGYFELRDDANAAHAPLGWGNVSREDVYAAGTPTWPAAGRLR